MILSEEITNKIRYFLRRFPSKEWSGPAWYSLKTNKTGYPVSFKLEEFHPLDLGGHSSTEWDAKDLAVILKDKLKNKALKKCLMGLLHSHHTMGAFFSGTDSDTILDMAPMQGFYPSLVVASGGKAEYAFGFSYQDQYGSAHWVEFDDDDKVKGPKIKARKDWVKIASHIEEENKATTAVTTYYPKTGYGYNGYTGYTGYGMNHNQVDVFREKKTASKGLTLETETKALEIMHDWEEGVYDYQTMCTKLKDMGIDPWEFCGGGIDAAIESGI